MEKLLLVGCQELFNLMGSPLQGLEQTDLFFDVQHRRTDIHIRKRHWLIIRPIALDPDR